MNKIIWMYWHQGFHEAGEVVRECVKSWESCNPEWRVILLDDQSIRSYVSTFDIPEDKFGLLRLQHRSDLIRTKLLIKYGGVWADATCYCAQPLDNWLYDHLDAGVFFFHKPARDRLIGNWFIAVDAPDNALLQEIYQRLCRYWATNDFRNLRAKYPRVEGMLQRFVNRNPFLTRLWLTFFFRKVVRLYPYMIYHYIFNEVVLTHPGCRRIWNRMPKLSASDPPVLKRLGLLSPLTDDAKRIIDDRQIPLFKLNWKLETPQIKNGTILHYLFKSHK